MVKRTSSRAGCCVLEEEDETVRVNARVSERRVHRETSPNPQF